MKICFKIVCMLQLQLRKISFHVKINKIELLKMLQAVSWDHGKIYYSCSITKSCPTPCNSMDYSPPGFSVLGISKARTLEWVAIYPPGDLPDPGTKPASPESPALVDGFFTTEPTWEAWMGFSLSPFGKFTLNLNAARAG